MNKIFSFCCSLLLLSSLNVSAQSFSTVFETSNGKKSVRYAALIAYYQRLDAAFPTIKMNEIGTTDANEPLRVVFYSKDKKFDSEAWKQENKIVLLINNGIHPGEPDGIDACMMLLRDAAQGTINIPENVVLAVIPVFNIGGMLNRGSYSRANQNGPEAYGFRGNAQNLDLNRDFIKMDAKETRSLVKLFHRLDPDIFIDNHVSNGADYRHIVTLLTTNAEKQGFYLGNYLHQTFEPTLYKMMQKRGYDLVPYVNHWGNTPDKGWTQFYDPPRFTSGFAALFGSFAFVTETHMLKPFQQRVKGTYDLMLCFIRFAAQHQQELKDCRAKEKNHLSEQQKFTLDWTVDTTQHSTITFKGYAAKYKPSKVSGKPRLYYDRHEPYTKQIPFYDHYLPTKSATAPQYYVLQQGWQKLITRLKLNGVKMLPLKKDTTITLTVYRIKDYETVKKPYEGHYLHKNVTYTAAKEKVKLRKGDYLIPTQQNAKRYLVETLEPDAPDAFFAWNFFDAVLQQKEYFSDYVFEDDAAELLKANPALQKALDAKRNTDTSFAQNGEAQLAFIYQHSPYQEPEYLRHPVFRIN